MPHIAAKIFPGRSQETKLRFARAVREAAVELLGTEARYVSVSVEDVPPDRWPALYEAEIAGDPNLVLPPGYPALGAIKQEESL